MGIVLIRVSIAVQRHHDHSSSYKGKHLIVVACFQFRGSVYYHYDGEQGSMLTDMLLEKELEVLTS